MKNIFRLETALFAAGTGVYTAVRTAFAAARTTAVSVMVSVVVSAAVTVSLSGCRADAVLPVPQGNPVSVKIGSRAALGATMQGMTVNSVRIVAVNSAGRVTYNQYAKFVSSDGQGNVTTEGNLGYNQNPAFDENDASSGDYTATLYPGTYDFYAIVNEEKLDAENLAALRALNLDDTADDLAAIEVPDGMTETDMICVGRVTAAVAATEEDTPTAIITVDGSEVEALNIPVHRVAAKIIVNAQKSTTDDITINSVYLSHALYSHLLPTPYAGELSSTTLTETDTALSSTASTLVDSHILPEHILGAGGTSHTTLTLNATHTSGIFSAGEAYTMPLLGNAANLDVKRGTIYTVNVTISKSGEYSYTPYITYSVADWEQVGGGSVDIGGVINATASWAAGTRFETDGGNVVLVGTNGSVTLSFGLYNPVGARWRASLTNTRDFAITGASEGVTGEDPYAITIAPKGEFSSDDIATELSIYINTTGEADGWEEWDINGGNTGLRYTIKYSQI